MTRALKAALKWVRRILMGIARMDLQIEVCVSEEMKRALFQKRKP